MATSNPKTNKKPVGLRVQTEPNNDDNDYSPNRGAVPRSRNLARISPNLTPKDHLKKFLENKPSPLTTRAGKLNISQDKSFERPKTERESRSPNFGYNNKDADRSTEDQSEDSNKKLLDVSKERKYLEEQYKLMENRVKRLMDENDKIKGKIKLTRNQTQNMIKNREKVMTEEEKLKLRQELVEKEIMERKEKIAEMRQDQERKRKEKQEQLLKEKLKIAAEIKQQKARDQELKEELKREDEIKKNERIWKIALHEKELENSKMYQKIKTRDVAKKQYDSKMEDEEKKAEEIEKKIKELEQLEMKLIEDLKNTNQNHQNAFAEMEKVYESRLTPRQVTPTSASGTTTKSVSPWRGKNAKEK